MNLTILTENYTSLNKKLLAEPGLSIYLEDDDEKILFDTGYSGVFAQNAKTLGIDLTTLTKVVISHGHDDHTGGLCALLPLIKKGTPLFAHPDTFNIKLRGTLPTGSPLRDEELAKTFTLHLSKAPQKISNHLTFLGEIPNLVAFEPRIQFDEKITPSGRKPDYVFEDSALVFEKENGIYIITGCSHPGICNICEYAKHLFEKPILGVIGGFHLKEVNDRVIKTIAYFRQEKIHAVYPCHCTSFFVRAAFHAAFPIEKEISVGTKIEW